MHRGEAMQEAERFAKRAEGAMTEGGSRCYEKASALALIGQVYATLATASFPPITTGGE